MHMDNKLKNRRPIPRNLKNIYKEAMVAMKTHLPQITLGQERAINKLSILESLKIQWQYCTYCGNTRTTTNYKPTKQSMQRNTTKNEL